MSLTDHHANSTMKAAAAIGMIFIIGGAAGLLRPRDWQYAPTNRYGGSTGEIRTITKEGTRYLSVGAVVLGVSACVISVRSTT